MKTLHPYMRWLAIWLSGDTVWKPGENMLGLCPNTCFTHGLGGLSSGMLII